MRDLFQQDDGGWLQDAGLLARLVAEKLERDAEALRAEGWKWVEVATEFPYGHTYGLRRIPGERRPLTDEEIAQVEALRAEAERLEEDAAQADEVPEEVDQRLSEIEAEIDALDERPPVYDPAEIALAGVFVSIDGSGKLRVERGYVRPEDEPPVVEEADEAAMAGEDGGRGKGAMVTTRRGRGREIRHQRTAGSSSAMSAMPPSRRKKTASSPCPTGC